MPASGCFYPNAAQAIESRGPYSGTQPWQPGSDAVWTGNLLITALVPVLDYAKWSFPIMLILSTPRRVMGVRLTVPAVWKERCRVPYLPMIHKSISPSEWLLFSREVSRHNALLHGPITTLGDAQHKCLLLTGTILVGLLCWNGFMGERKNKRMRDFDVYIQ